MTLPPIPPSDNLYKFTAIGGLILAVLSLYVPQQLSTQHRLSTIEVNSELEKINKDGQVLEQEFEGHMDNVNSMVQQAEKAREWEADRLKRGERFSQEAITERDKAIDLLISRLEYVDRETTRLLDRQRENRYQLHNTTSGKEKLTYLKLQLDKLFWTSVGTFFLGIIMMVYGFWNWYFKFQVYQDQIVKAQAAQWTTPKPETTERVEVPGETI